MNNADGQRSETYTRRRLLATAAGGGLLLGSQQSTQASDLASLSIEAASALIRKKNLSTVELTRACLQRIERFNPIVNAFITVTAQAALAQAEELQQEATRRRWRGPLHGIPIALKDNIDTAGIKTTCASALFADRVPADDAEVVRRLKTAGAITRNAPKDTGDGSLRDDDSEHLQFPMDPWCPPKWVCSRHVENEATYLGCDGRSVATDCLPLRNTSPELAEALALPSHDRVRLHDKQSGSPPTPDFGQRTPEQTIEGGQFRFDALLLIGRKLKS